jgi:acylpyruvate hydrolase
VFVTGTNYRSHVDEMASSVPPVPTANLMKLPHVLSASGDEITLPPTACIDYEGEIAIVIGADARHVDPADAERMIAGLCLANDVSARDAPTTHLLLAKNSRGFGPLGPLVPVEHVDLDSVSFVVSVNGETRQIGDTRDMVHSIREIVASYSAALPLGAGDVILTGSPSGVGVARHPPVFLEDGDTVVVESPELGTLSNRFVASPPLINGPSGTEAS